MRNFWLSAQIDGRANPLEGGPRSKEGNMVIYLYVKDHKESTPLLEICCAGLDDEAGTDEIHVFIKDLRKGEETVHTIHTGV